MDENSRIYGRRDIFAKPSLYEVAVIYAEELRKKLKDTPLHHEKQKFATRKISHPGSVDPMLTIVALLNQFIRSMWFASWGGVVRIPSVSLFGCFGFGIGYFMIALLTLCPEPNISLDVSGLVMQKGSASQSDRWDREEIPNHTNYPIPPELYPEISYDIRHPLIIASSNLPLESFDQGKSAPSPVIKKVQMSRNITPVTPPKQEPKRTPANGLYHVVRARENLWTIAQNYRVSQKKVIAANPYINPTRLMPGDKIFVPDAAAAPSGSDKMISPFPGARVISGYGYRKHPIGGSIRFHEGIDLPAKTGTPIRAVLDGKVVYASKSNSKYSLGGKGLVVEIQHQNGLKTVYAHNSKILCKVGQYVKQGTVISLAGSTGRTTGSHLHFEVWKDGKHQNPEQYLRLPSHTRR
ncbi:MAG: LysM peptidoglycan-binding domain-containing protein [Candidatus Omnitrophota bacterium]|jgi:LysM repeat protein|nr:MAG: LysM peptidoglycan-binding domain-containing protein [Candidatus Omnitrophota bacterium]